ncbi:MAG: amidophosphoribosyltransferase [Candidatus Bathyarchaeia archaeon]
MGCGVYGVIDCGREPILQHLYWGLKSLNHRGHQSHGFATYNGSLHTRRGLGLIPRIDMKGMEEWMAELPGHVGIGNTRYSTSGGLDKTNLLKDTQPVVAEAPPRSWVTISYNGNLVNALRLEREIQAKAGVRCSCDSVALCWKLLMELQEHGDLPEAVKACMAEVEGAYSVILLLPGGRLAAFKDPHGIRPLCAGSSPGGEVKAFSSESIGLDINGLNFEFEVNPGELVEAGGEGFTRIRLCDDERRLCAFEFAYFARPDSLLGERYVYEVREALGRNLAEEYHEILNRCDLIVSMPETADDAAFGMHEASGIRWERAIRRHRYVTERAFIMLSQERRTILNKKISILARRLSGKKIALIDDSIVRGDTMGEVIGRLRSSGAREIHVFVTFPRIVAPCFYGIDMATYGELIGASRTPEEVAEILQADSVNYQSIDSYVRATGLSGGELCTACVTGSYPTPIAQEMAERMKELLESGGEERRRIYEEEAAMERGDAHG